MQLLKIVSNILDVSKIQAGRMILEQREFNLRELLQDVFAVGRVKVCVQVLNFLFFFLFLRRERFLFWG